MDYLYWALSIIFKWYVFIFFMNVAHLKKSNSNFSEAPCSNFSVHSTLKYIKFIWLDIRRQLSLFVILVFSPLHSALIDICLFTKLLVPFSIKHFWMLSVSRNRPKWLCVTTENIMTYLFSQLLLRCFQYWTADNHSSLSY